MLNSFKNTLAKSQAKWLILFDQAVVSGGNFTVGILLARELGIALYGEFAVCWLLVLFWSSIHHGWLITPMYTFVAQFQAKARINYLNSLLVHQVAFAVLASTLTAAFIPLAPLVFPEMHLAALYLLLPTAVFMHLMYDFVRRAYYANESSRQAFLLDVLVYGSQAGALLFTAWLGQLNLKLAVGIIACSYTPALVLGAKLFRAFSWNQQAFVQTTQKHWNYAKWLVGTALLQWLSGNFFIIAAGGILGPVAVGAIRILQNIVGVLHVLFLALENYIPIQASKIFQTQGAAGLGSFLRQYTWKGGLATLVVASGLAFFGQEIISLLYGSEHSDYAYLLYGFAVLYLLVFVGSSIRFAIRTLEKTSAIFLAYILSAAFSLLTAHWMVQQIGIEGIVWGLIANQLILQGYLIYVLQSKKDLLWKSYT